MILTIFMNMPIWMESGKWPDGCHTKAKKKHKKF